MTEQGDIFGHVDYRKRAAGVIRKWNTKIGMARELNIYDKLCLVDEPETVTGAVLELAKCCNNPTMLIFRGSMPTYEECKARYLAGTRAKKAKPYFSKPMKSISELLHGNR
jgi:hypothetical protein